MSKSPYKCNRAARISCSRAFSLLPLAPMIREYLLRNLLVIVSEPGTLPAALHYIVNVITCDSVLISSIWMEIVDAGCRLGPNEMFCRDGDVLLCCWYLCCCWCYTAGVSTVVTQLAPIPEALSAAPLTPEEKAALRCTSRSSF